MNVGMYNVANTSLQESSLEMTLVGLKLEKYFQLFTKKGIKFDTFVNMTEEDLSIVGITNEDDIKTILEGVSPLKHLYKDINEPPPYNLELLLGNNVHHLRTLLGLTILLRRKLTQKGSRPKNTLMDVTHSSASAVATLTEALIEQLDHIEEDLAKAEVSQKHSSKKWLIITSGFVLTGALSTFILQKYTGRSYVSHFFTLKFR